MSLNKLIRKIHLGASIIMLSFLLMYIFSGILLINRTLFNVPEFETSYKKSPITHKMEGNPDVYAHILKDELELKGRVSYNQNWQKNWVFHYDFPGYEYQITLNEEQDSLHIKHMVQERTFFTVLHQMHVLRGFKGGLPYTIWAVFYDLSCIAMLVFAITGIIMWWKMRKRYKYGVWHLLAGLALPLTILLLFAFWK